MKLLANDSRAAARHFAAVEKIGASPITRGRAFYWEGRAAEAKGDRAGARAFYEQGAQYVTSFYGQLAAEKLGRPLVLPRDPGSERLRDQDPVVTPALQWLERQLEAQGITSDEIVRVEHQQQAAMNVTVRNVITSMRLISAFDWAEFFESVSFVDAILWTGNGFAAPDFATRDRYRRTIEELSRGSQQDELEVARRAVLRAKGFRSKAQAASDPAGDRRADPGYYLIANGRLAFEQELGFRMPIKTRLLRAYVTQATSRYLGTIAIVSGLILALFLFSSGAAQVGVVGLLLLGLLALVPASDLAIALVNREVMELLGPRALPRLALRDGVPADLRTLVVVPTLLTGHAQIAEQIEHGGAPLLVERPEDLVQHQERERLPGPLGDHLADGQAERQIGHVLLAP